MPFLVCIIVVLFFKRTSLKRRVWLKLGIEISSVYLLFTIGNKLYIDSIFKKFLKDNASEASRFSTQPSIFNNILWYGIAETETSYEVAYYSLFDSTNRFSEWLEIPKTRAITKDDFSDIKDLAWFSKSYFNVIKRGGNEYLYNDLSYPLVKK